MTAPRDSLLRELLACEIIEAGERNPYAGPRKVVDPALFSRLRDYLSVQPAEPKPESPSAAPAGDTGAPDDLQEVLAELRDHGYKKHVETILTALLTPYVRGAPRATSGIKCAGEAAAYIRDAANPKREI